MPISGIQHNDSIFVYCMSSLEQIYSVPLSIFNQIFSLEFMNYLYILDITPYQVNDL